MLSVCSVLAISPFPTEFFERLVLQTSENMGLFWKQVNPLLYNVIPASSKLKSFAVNHFSNKPWFFLAPLAVGQRAYVMVCCLSCVCESIRLCVRRLCVNFFFKQLLLWNYLSDFDQISQKCFCHGPLQNFLKEFDSFKNSGKLWLPWQQNLNIFWNLWKSSCQKP